MRAACLVSMVLFVATPVVYATRKIYEVDVKAVGPDDDDEYDLWGDDGDDNPTDTSGAGEGKTIINKISGGGVEDDDNDGSGNPTVREYSAEKKKAFMAEIDKMFVKTSELLNSMKFSIPNTDSGVKYLTGDQLCLLNHVVNGGKPAAQCVPVPSIQSCCPVNSESAFGEAESRPSQEYGGHELEPNLATKAALTGFPISQNEAFNDGNKRTGMFAQMHFLSANGYEVKDKAAFWEISSECADEEADEWCYCNIEKFLQQGGTEPALPALIPGGNCEE